MSDLSSAVTRDTSVRYQMEPLRLFLDDPDITEVCINRPGEVFTEKHSVWERHEVAEVTLAHTLAFGIATARYMGGQPFEESSPILSAVLPDQERVQFVRAPAAESGTISVTIRKPSRSVRTLDDYEQQGFFKHIRPISNGLTPQELELMQLKNDGNYLQFLRRAVQHEKVIFVVGETGSGKTTFMKGLVQEIPSTQRVVTIEDVPELFLPNHPNHVHLFYPSEGDERAPVTAQRLLKSCMRMKPNRILQAELRGGEAFDFINVCASGHGGSITSGHAGSASLGFERLANMVLENSRGRTLPYDAIRKLLYLVVDVVLHVHNDTVDFHGRHITELWFDPMKKREPAKEGGFDAALLMNTLAAIQAQLGQANQRIAELEMDSNRRAQTVSPISPISQHLKLHPTKVVPS